MRSLLTVLSCAGAHAHDAPKIQPVVGRGVGRGENSVLCRSLSLGTVYSPQSAHEAQQPHGHLLAHRYEGCMWLNHPHATSFRHAGLSFAFARPMHAHSHRHKGPPESLCLLRPTAAPAPSHTPCSPPTRPAARPRATPHEDPARSSPGPRHPRSRLLCPPQRTPSHARPSASSNLFAGVVACSDDHQRPDLPWSTRRMPPPARPCPCVHMLPLRLHAVPRGRIISRPGPSARRARPAAAPPGPPGRNSGVRELSIFGHPDA